MKNTLYILTFLLAGIPFETVAQDTLSKAEKKEIRKNKRSAKRYVHPKSVFYSYSVGFTINKIKFSEENEYFNRTLRKINTRNFSFEAEIGTRNNFFYEVGAKFRDYKYTFSVKTNQYPEDHPRYFDGIMIYGGYGKRIILRKSNLNIVNVQAGVSLFMPIYKSVGRYIADPSFDQGYDKNYNFKQYEIENSNRIIPTLYIGLNKDIRIYKRFYFSIGYRYDLGFISLYKQKLEFSKKSNPNEITTVYNHFRGTAHAVSIGFKHRFLAKKYK